MKQKIKKYGLMVIFIILGGIILFIRIQMGLKSVDDNLENALIDSILYGISIFTLYFFINQTQSTKNQTQVQLNQLDLNKENLSLQKTQSDNLNKQIDLSIKDYDRRIKQDEDNNKVNIVAGFKVTEHRTNLHAIISNLGNKTAYYPTVTLTKDFKAKTRSIQEILGISFDLKVSLPEELAILPSNEIIVTFENFRKIYMKSKEKELPIGIKKQLETYLTENFDLIVEYYKDNEKERKETKIFKIKLKDGFTRYKIINDFIPELK